MPLKYHPCFLAVLQVPCTEMCYLFCYQGKRGRVPVSNVHLKIWYSTHNNFLLSLRAVIATAVFLVLLHLCARKLNSSVPNTLLNTLGSVLQKKCNVKKFNNTQVLTTYLCSRNTGDENICFFLTILRSYFF